MCQKLSPQRIGRHEQIHRIFHRLQPRETPRSLFDHLQRNAVACAESIRRFHRFAQFFHQLCFVSHRVLSAFARSVNRQRLFQRGEDIRVIHNHAAVFAGKHPIRPRDGLHQRVVPHRLVEIHRGATRRIEARQPHRADKDQPQRVFRILELLIQRFQVHPLPMRLDVQPELSHLRNLVLPRRHNQRHIRRFEDFQFALQFRQLRRTTLLLVVRF